MADLIINNREAFNEWGVRMGDNFLDALGTPAPLKEFIENKSRLEDGKRVIINNPKLDERDLTLTFTIAGNSESDYQTKKRAFESELYKGAMTIKVPANGDEVYHLIYTGKCISFAQGIDRTFGKISAKFNEPNPANRS